MVLALVGWWVQIVQYPAFRTWEPDEFQKRHARYTFGVSWVVVPAMFAQLGSVAWVALHPGTSPIWKALNVALLLSSVGPTLLVSGPIHGRLSKGKDSALVERLIRANLPRTLAWSFHAMLAGNWILASN